MVNDILQDMALDLIERVDNFYDFFFMQEDPFELFQSSGDDLDLEIELYTSSMIVNFEPDYPDYERRIDVIQLPTRNAYIFKLEDRKHNGHSLLAADFTDIPEAGYVLLSYTFLPNSVIHVSEVRGIEPRYGVEQIAELMNGTPPPGINLSDETIDAAQNHLLRIYETAPDMTERQLEYFVRKFNKVLSVLD